MRTPLVANRPGFTLTEVLVALTMTAIIGAAATGVLVNQSRFIDQQEKLSGARQVARGASNILMHELRMVEVGSGASVLAASADSITVQVPFAFGLVCGSNTGNTRTVVSLLPVDSAVFSFASANYTGWARRNGVGATHGYSYASTSPRSITAAVSAAVCTDAAITLLPGGRVLELRPHVPGAIVAAPMFLFQRVTYKFAPAPALGGMRALWRHNVTAGTSPEMLEGPYAESARFRFYSGSARTASDAPGTLANLRGVEIVLTGRSERRAAGGSHDRAELTTAVFFRNRLD